MYTYIFKSMIENPKSHLLHLLLRTERLACQEEPRQWYRCSSARGICVLVMKQKNPAWL